jgi:hypothetical protein
MDWDGNLYCSICLTWDYVAHTLNIPMLGYILKQFLKYKHTSPTKPQHCPYAPQPKRYGSEAQQPLHLDPPPLPLSKDNIKHVIGSILYYT